MPFTLRCFLFTSCCIAAVSTTLMRGGSDRQQNNAPVVRISAPGDSGLFALHATVPYTIVVSDKEDGESKYDEIPASEVFLEIRYFAEPLKGSAFRHDLLQNELPGYAAIRKQDCFTCHAVRSKVIGPSFSDISSKYKNLPDVSRLASHVLKGSTGIWGSAVMPTHPDLSEKEAQQIVRWILDNTSNRDVDYFRGTQGSIRIDPPGDNRKGVFVLKATYTDHGIDNSPSSRLTGHDMTLIRIK